MQEIKSNKVPLKIATTANKITQALTKKLKKYGIAPEQRAILDIIDNDNTISQNDLANMLGKDKTTISRNLESIEKKGFISREYLKEDRRVKIIKLTPQGTQVLNTTKDLITKFRANVTDNLSQEEFSQIELILEKIVINVNGLNDE